MSFVVDEAGGRDDIVMHGMDDEELIDFEDEVVETVEMSRPFMVTAPALESMQSPVANPVEVLESEESSTSDSSHSGDSDTETEVDPREALIPRIQGLLLSFLKQLADCTEGIRKTVTIQLADRRKPRGEDGEMQMRTLVFPRSTRNGTSMQGFAVLIAVLTYIYEALVTGVPITKRDIYYRDVALFKRQSVVDNLVDDIAATFEVERDDLLVRASSKGLFCGGILCLKLRNGAIVSGDENQPTMIPSGDDIEEMVVDEDIGWILVVEKEAIFQTLCQVGFANDNALQKPGIIFTGKGYPDIATRQLVHKLSSALPESIPIFALVDADPYGVDILSCYAFGSESLYHQREELIAERIEWLGVRFSELEGLGIPQEALLPLTERDERKVATILSRSDEMMPRAWKDELRCMLETGLKAEIEVVCTRQGSDGHLPLVRYLENKMLDYFDQ
ncbi:hypothetical protein M408DRAFT_214618 [Serendipita vermifera MAFF 305830]|uniref:DNA topoisomerase (ATP-hydrolyzing) n=1 Tax=Serendipita vermifera MAFF 305830 TaxID=933852 RepID=A0A0C3BJB0_SERVB|nr:hypothetical protein M408DRAFT_214618 [Serendipita vermifera MAFF 305830]